MSYLDMAHDAGLRGDEARQYAQMLEYEDYRQHMEHDFIAQCNDEGHKYHSDEFDQDYIDAAPEEQRAEITAASGRCYCGARRFPLGGPKDQVGESER